MNTESSEVAGEERNVVLVAVTSEGFDIRQVFTLCQANPRSSLLHCRLRFRDFRVGLQGQFQALLAQTTTRRRRNLKIECYFFLEWKADRLAKLPPQVGELQISAQQFLFRLEGLCPALNEVCVKGATVFHLLHTLTLKVFACENLRLDRTAA